MKQVLKKGGAAREFYISELVTHIIRDEPKAGDEGEEEEGAGQGDTVTVHVSSGGRPLSHVGHVAVTGWQCNLV